MSSSNRVRLSIVREVARGVTPATPAWQVLRWLSESLNYNIENTQSDEVNSDRAKGDLVQVGFDVSGDLAFELSHLTYETMLEGLFCSVATGSTTKTLVNGTSVLYHSILKEFLDLAGIRQRFLGCVINQLDLTFKKRSKVTGSFSILGMDYADTAVAGSTVVPQTTTQVLNTSSHVTGILMNDVPMTTCIDMLNIKVNNNFRATTCVGAQAVREYVSGDFDLTGGMDVYFNDLETFNMYRAGAPFSLLVNVEDDAGNESTWRMPRLKFETLKVAAGGGNQDVMAVGTFRGSRGAGGIVLEHTSTPA